MSKRRGCTKRRRGGTGPLPALEGPIVTHAYDEMRMDSKDRERRYRRMMRVLMRRAGMFSTASK